MIEQVNNFLREAIVLHSSYDRALSALKELLQVARGTEGTVIPLLGPTRCGKTEVLIVTEN